MQEICSVEVSELIDWITQIPFKEWPQQSKLEDGKIRPAMVTDLSWHDFGEKVSDTIASVSPGRIAYSPMLSVVMPGHSIPAHKDQQPKEWLCRVHVPLTTNVDCWHIEDGQKFFHMEVGKAYLIDTRVEHEVRNDGYTPRIHFMFDVRQI